MPHICADEIFTDRTTEVLYGLAARYNIKLEWLAEGAVDEKERRAKQYPSDFSWGTQEDCGFSFKERYVYGYECEAAFIFHELVHLIVGPPGQKVCEGFVLMPFEYELAKYAARSMDADASWFLQEVRDYQECTYIQVGPHKDDLEDLCPKDRTRAWWQRSLVRARHLKLLDRYGRPTFQDAQWEGTDLFEKGKTWHTRKRFTI